MCLTNCFTDQEGVGNNEPSKRQRRWNSESLKLPELQSSTPTSTPRDTLQPSMKRNFSRSDSAVSDDTPKERIGELTIFVLMMYAMFFYNGINVFYIVTLQFLHHQNLQQTPSGLITLCVRLH